MSYSKATLIENLVHTSNYTDELKKEVVDGLHLYSEEEMDKIIELLNLNQVCPISSGRNYTTTDIINKLRKEIL